MLTNKPKHFYNPSAVIIRVSNCHMLSSLCVKVQLQHVRDYKSFIEENFLHNIDPQIIKSFIIVVIQLLLFLLRWFRAAADKHTNTHTHTHTHTHKKKSNNLTKRPKKISELKVKILQL